MVVGDKDSTAKEPSNADDPSKKFADEPSSNTAGGGSEPASGTPTEDNSGAPRGPSVETNCKVEEVLNILDLRDETKKWLEENFAEQKSFEDFIQMSSEKVKDEAYDKDGKKHARFNQVEREKLILLRRWMKKNKKVDGQEVKFKCGGFDRDSFETFVNEEVLKVILDEILKELKLSEEVKETLEGNGVHTPANFVMKSKYWYVHEMKLSSADIHKIEKFKHWYKYQLDTYLPSDWIVSFRKEAEQVKELEWRKVLKAIGLKADAIQALEINDVCDFATLNRKSKEWKISERSFDEPSSRGGVSDSGSPSTQPDSPIGGASGSDSSSTQPPISNTEKWDGWQTLGLKENDSRHIINFRHWHNFYVAGKKDKSNWAAEFNSAQYERYVQRYIDPITLDEFGKPGWWALRSRWALRSDKLKTSKEKQEYDDILQAAAENGVVAEKDRYRLRQHYKGRREKMELIQEINEGVGDSSFQEKRLGEIFEEEAAIDSTKDEKRLMFFQQYYQFVFSALVVYALVLCWVGTTIVFMADSDFVTIEKIQETTYVNNSYAVFLHNITFGLVTTVVIQELGEEYKKTSLYYRFLPIYNELLDRSKKTRFRAKLMLRSKRTCCCWRYFEFGWEWVASYFFFHPLTWFILNSTRFYILFWVVFGAASLGYGIEKELKPESPNPLYTTGQTWVGIAVTIAFSYFGLNGKNSPKIEDAKDENDQRIKDAVQRAIGGGYGANGGEVKFTNEKGETKVINTHHELMHEIDRYKGLQKKAVDDRPQDAADYKTCVDRLEMLKPMLPSEEDLGLQLKVAEAKMKAAVNEKDIDAEVKFHKEVIKLKKKLKEEEDAKAAAASGDASSS